MGSTANNQVGSGGVTVFAPNGGPPLGTAPASFAAASAHGIAFVAASPNGPLNRIVVGNASAAPKLAIFTENGASLGTKPLAAAPIALAYAPPIGPGNFPQTTAQIYVTSATALAAWTGAVIRVIATPRPRTAGST